jgi:hypothetical protein
MDESTESDRVRTQAVVLGRRRIVGDDVGGGNRFIGNRIRIVGECPTVSTAVWPDDVPFAASGVTERRH